MNPGTSQLGGWQPGSWPREVPGAALTRPRLLVSESIACWMGLASIGNARGIFRAAGIPAYRLPEPSVEAFAHLAQHYRNQRLLASISGEGDPDTVRTAIRRAATDRVGP